MIKKLDKYILSKFLGTFFLIIALFILIAVVFDISEKVDDFDKFTIGEIIFDYYFSFIPWLYNLLTPILVFIAVIFFTSQMANKTEIIPILASGISFNRFLRPYLIGASFLFTLAFLMSHFLIPKTNKKKVEMENIIYSNSHMIDNTNVHKEIEPGVYIYMKNYSKKSDIGYGFKLDKINHGELTYQFTATNIKWDHNTNRWIARNWSERIINGKEEILKQGASIDTVFNFTYHEFHKSPYIIETMDFFEIDEFIEEERAKGSVYVKIFELELIKRTSNPFSIFMLTLIGACIAAKKVKGGTGMHIVYGLSLALLYIFLGKIAETFAVKTAIPTVLAVWIPNIIFIGVTYLIYKKAPK